MSANGYHPTAIVDSRHVGDGTRIWAYAHVLPHAVIGSDCNIGDHSFVETGAVIGDNVTIKNHVCVWEGVTLKDDVFVGPLACFTNDLHPRSPRMPAARDRYAVKENWLVRTVVEQGATIGGNATIVGGVRLGRYCFVAAGAIVTRDVESFGLVIGAPARLVNHVCRCGQALGPDFPDVDCSTCGTTRKFFQQVCTASDK